MDFGDVGHAWTSMVSSFVASMPGSTMGSGNSAYHAECAAERTPCLMMRSHSWARANSMHFNQIACVVSGYRAIRRLIRTRTCQLANTETYYSNSLHKELWSVFADAFAADARGLMVAHRKFSLPSFLSMLIDPSSFSIISMTNATNPLCVRGHSWVTAIMLNNSCKIMMR